MGGTSRVTLLDVAREAKVSRTTVSNAFNDPTQLSAEMRARVLDVAAGMGYLGPDPAARAVRRGRVGVAGVVFRETLPFALEDPFVRILLAGVADELSAAGRGLSLLPVGPGRNLLANAIIDGVVALRLRDADESLVTACARGLRIVRIGTSADDKLGMRVEVDEASGAAAAAQHLVELGHRRLHVLIDMTENLDVSKPVEEQFVFSEQRLRWGAYARVSAAAGAELVPIAAGRNVQESGLRAASMLLDTADVTALVCMTDVLALGAIQAVREKGQVPGRDVSIIGYDDVPDAARQQLTTVRQPIFERGQAAGRLLLAEDVSARTVTLPCDLVVRGSTGPPPSGAR